LDVVHYPLLVANVVIVPKKDGKIRVCMDYRDLNKTNLKNDVPLPYKDQIVRQEIVCWWLATLTLMTQINIEGRIQPINIEVRNFQAYYYSLKELLERKLWYSDIKKFIQHWEYPLGAYKTDEKTWRMMALDYYLGGKIMYKRSLDVTLLMYLNEKKVG